MTTARIYLKQLLDEVDAGPTTMSRVCAAAGLHQSQVSRWKKRDIEPRLSTLDRLFEAHSQLVAEHNIAQAALSQ
jgi:predicted transcriptional regulator